MLSSVGGTNSIIIEIIVLFKSLILRVNMHFHFYLYDTHINPWFFFQTTEPHHLRISISIVEFMFYIGYQILLLQFRVMYFIKIQKKNKLFSDFLGCIPMFIENRNYGFCACTKHHLSKDDLSEQFQHYTHLYFDSHSVNGSFILYLGEWNIIFVDIVCPTALKMYV